MICKAEKLNFNINSKILFLEISSSLERLIGTKVKTIPGYFFITTEVILAFSIIASIKTCVMSRYQHINVEKEGFFPSVGKILIIFTSLTSILGRVSSMLLFFGPSLGLFDLMNHWMWKRLVSPTSSAFSRSTLALVEREGACRSRSCNQGRGTWRSNQNIIKK